MVLSKAEASEIAEVSETLEEVLKKALEVVVPDREEVEKGRRAERILRDRLERVVESDISYEFVGSYARNTWLKGNLEIDVFLLFPESYTMEELEKKGLEIGKAVVDSYELRYAAHPYVHGVVEGVEVDVVPCYKLKSPERIKTAVDRTPFHHRWLKERIRGKENDVRLLKGFLKAGRLYGAEYRVKGFSGYLCELLVVFYGSFLDVVSAATSFTRKTVIDVNSGKVGKGETFFVVDPVDARRNVAANLSVDNLARFVQRCRSFLKNPAVAYFKPEKVEVKLDEILKELRRRNVFCLVTLKPEIVEDNLYTQLERGGKKLFDHLERLGFRPMREQHFADDRFCYILIETEVDELSPVEKRMGPPFEDRKNVEKFLKKHKNAFVEDGRFWVYAPRKFKNAVKAIEGIAKNEWRVFGKNVGNEVKKWFEVFAGERLIRICVSEENAEQLAAFLGLVPDTGYRVLNESKDVRM